MVLFYLQFQIASTGFRFPIGMKLIDWHIYIFIIFGHSFTFVFSWKSHVLHGQST